MSALFYGSFAFVLTTLAVVDAKVASGRCKLSSWSSWTQRGEPHHHTSVKSHAVSTATKHKLRGELMRDQNMAAKLEMSGHRYDCLHDGTCPELMWTLNDGAHRCENGEINKKLPCRNIHQRSFVSMETLGADMYDMGNDIWGWTDPEDSEEYAIMGTQSGTSFVRVTDPERPVVLGFLPTHTSSSIWRDMKVINDHVFIVAEAWGHGIQVFDLTRLRGQCTFQTFTEDYHYGHVGRCHNIVQFPEYEMVYAVGCTEDKYNKMNCDGGLHAIDVSVPKFPRFAGCFAEDGYVHDAQCEVYRGPDIAYQGRGVCFCYNEDTLTIVDVSAASNMNIISRMGYEAAKYTHQGWVTDDHTLLLLDDEIDEILGDGIQRTYIWDISDLNNPELVNTYDSGILSIDHNQYILGDLSYQANYKSGLRVVHIDQEDRSLQEVAYFDVFPAENSDTFGGSWSVYPYFNSGNLVISSMEYGLFVVTPDHDAIKADIAAGKRYTERNRYRSILDGSRLEDCPALVNTATMEK